MKCNINKVNKKETFEPFDFTLKIETIEEARLLWHVLNTANLRGLLEEDEGSRHYMIKPFEEQFDFYVWEKLDEYMNDQGYEL